MENYDVSSNAIAGIGMSAVAAGLAAIMNRPNAEG